MTGSWEGYSISAHCRTCKQVAWKFQISLGTKYEKMLGFLCDPKFASKAKFPTKDSPVTCPPQKASWDVNTMLEKQMPIIPCICYLHIKVLFGIPFQLVLLLDRVVFGGFCELLAGSGMLVDRIGREPIKRNKKKWSSNHRVLQQIFAYSTSRYILDHNIDDFITGCSSLKKHLFQIKESLCGVFTGHSGHVLSSTVCFLATAFLEKRASTQLSQNSFGRSLRPSGSKVAYI